MSKIPQKIFFLLLISTFLFSCDKTEEVEIVIPKTRPKLVEFGFNLHDFNVINDTVKSGDTFGSLIEKQNRNKKEVYDIVLKVKDSFDVRTIRKGKPYTILRSKNKTNKMVRFVRF